VKKEISHVDRKKTDLGKEFSAPKTKNKTGILEVVLFWEKDKVLSQKKKRRRREGASQSQTSQRLQTVFFSIVRGGGGRGTSENIEV